VAYASYKNVCFFPQLCQVPGVTILKCFGSWLCKTRERKYLLKQACSYICSLFRVCQTFRQSQSAKCYTHNLYSRQKTVQRTPLYSYLACVKKGVPGAGREALFRSQNSKFLQGSSHSQHRELKGERFLT
jgi:hypothetical protein